MNHTITHVINRVFMRPHFIGAAKFIVTFKRWYRFFFLMLFTAIFLSLVVEFSLSETIPFRKKFLTIMTYPMFFGVVLTCIGGIMHFVAGVGLWLVKTELHRIGHSYTPNYISGVVDEMIGHRSQAATSYWHFWGNHPGMIASFAIMLTAFVISIVDQTPIMTAFCVVVMAVILLYSWVWYQNQITEKLK